MCSHVPAAAQCVIASREHSSGHFGGESSGKSGVQKYFDKSADGKKAECKLCLKTFSISRRNQKSKDPSTRAAPIEIRMQGGEQHREMQEASTPYISDQVTSMHGIAI